MEAVAQHHTNKWRNQNLNLGSTAAVHVDLEPGRTHLLTTLTQSSNLSPHLLPPCVCSFFENVVLHLLLYSPCHVSTTRSKDLYTPFSIHPIAPGSLGQGVLCLVFGTSTQPCAACPVFSCDLVCFYYGMVSLIQSVLIVFPTSNTMNILNTYCNKTDSWKKEPCEQRKAWQYEITVYQKNSKLLISQTVGVGSKSSIKCKTIHPHEIQMWISRKSVSETVVTKIKY